MQTVASAVLPTGETSLYDASLLVERAEGLRVWCHGETQPYLDLVQGYSTTLLGHCHRVVVESLRRHAGRFDIVHSLLTAEALELGNTLTQHTGMPGGRVHFSVGGAEAVGVALRIARHVTQRSAVVCLRGSFHGLNADTLLLSRGFVTADPGYAFGETIEVAPGDPAAATLIERARPAALIFESVQAAAGWHILPEAWIREIAARCRALGALIIADEIQCGLGRCGEIAAFTRFGVIPDIALFGKALSGGAWPLGAVIVAAEVADALPQSRFGIGSTFSNNALACAIANDVFAYMIRERLWERAHAIGRYFLSRAEEFRTPLIRSVRAEGAGLALDLASARAATAFVDAALRRHILTYAAGVNRSVIKLSPPLTCSEDEITLIVDRLAAVAEQFATGGIDA